MLFTLEVLMLDLTTVSVMPLLIASITSTTLAYAYTGPMAAPVHTMGPSAPTEPPKPMVTELASRDVYMLCRFSRLLFCEIA